MLRDRRRLVFAAPFVTTVACHHEPPPVEPTTIASTPTAPSPDAAPSIRDAPPDAIAVDRYADPGRWHDVEYLPGMPALKHTLDCPPRASCNPPHPVMAGDTATTSPRWIAPDAGGGARARTRIVDDRMDRTWGAHFVDEHGAAFADGECSIVDVGIAAFDCVTSRPPRGLIEDATGYPHKLVVERPAARTQRPLAPHRLRILMSQRDGNEVVLTVSAGQDAGLVAEAHLVVLRGDTDEPLAGGDCVVVRIAKKTAVCRVRLTPEQLGDNRVVRVTY